MTSRINVVPADDDLVRRLKDLSSRLRSSFPLTNSRDAHTTDIAASELARCRNALEGARRAAYEHAAKVADYAVERAERDWRSPNKQEAVKQVGAEIAEVIRNYALNSDAALNPIGEEGAREP